MIIINLLAKYGVFLCHQLLLVTSCYSQSLNFYCSVGSDRLRHSQVAPCLSLVLQFLTLLSRNACKHGPSLSRPTQNRGGRGWKGGSGRVIHNVNCIRRKFKSRRLIIYTISNRESLRSDSGSDIN